MPFNSLDFAIFLPTVFILYWFVFNRSLETQNLLVVVASYIFYGWWDWRFLSLIIFSTLVDFIIGNSLGRSKNNSNRKILLWTSIIVNLGFLGFFKYYNFFIDNFITAFTFFGQNISPSTLNIILPVGISFYTFQTLSYTIDVYRSKMQPTKDFVGFAAFVSFFPQLVAGPIERASNLLPQFARNRKFDYGKAVDGSKQILWGLFKKMVIADNCAEYANQIFNNSDSLPGSTLVIGAFFFAFQIYGDFSGYSDIAIGTARLFGFDLMRNFAFPYFSRDIAEFWRRWHISLSTWFRDYVYIPLGGSKGSVRMKIRNVFIIFVLSGFWHGANWTFIVWGGLNALYFIPLMLRNKNRTHLDIVAEDKNLPTIREAFQIFMTFSLTLIAWIFFRSENVTHAFDILSSIFSTTLLSTPVIDKLAVFPMLFVIVFVIIEWFGRTGEYAIQKLFSQKPPYIRWAFYYGIAVSLILFMGLPESFIYFQF